MFARALRRLVAPGLAVAALAACGADPRLACTLAHVPAGLEGSLGRPLAVAWAAAPAPHVQLNGFAHSRGDGTTAYLRVSPEAFLLVVLQDVMRVPDGQLRPVRWTDALHFELDLAPDGSPRVLQWTRPVGLAGSPAALAARAGEYLPQPSRLDEPLVWRCSR